MTLTIFNWRAGGFPRAFMFAFLGCLGSLSMREKAQQSNCPPPNSLSVDVAKVALNGYAASALS